MKKKIFLILLLLVAAVAFIFIYKIKADYKKTDAYKFKTEYESLNDEKNDYGKNYRSLNIAKNNKMIYSTAKEIVEKTEKKETFIVYFGFSKCPWCRSMIENLVDLSIENDMNIYYVDVLEIRDTIEYVDGELKTTKEGDEYYMKLIELYSDVLSDYSVNNGEEKINTGEKRIYAPNVVAVINGQAKEMTEGISEKLEDPYGKITDEMKKASIKQLKCIFKCIKDAGICNEPASC